MINKLNPHNICVIKDDTKKSFINEDIIAVISDGGIDLFQDGDWIELSPSQIKDLIKVLKSFECK